MRAVHCIALLVPLLATAQVPVPIVTLEDRFLIFHNGRFEKMEPRPPAFTHAMDGQLIYRDHQGQLKVFLPEGRRLFLLDPRNDVVLRGTRHRVAWLAGDTLKTVREGHAVRIADHVALFEVSDSLVVVLDSALHELHVHWRGKVIPLATVQQGSDRPQWVQGTNTVAFFNKEARKLQAFQHGAVKTLCDSTDVGIVAAGGGIIGYWDGAQRAFYATWNGREEKLSELRPASAQAGEGLLAFVDGNGRLKCYEQGVLDTVLDEMPSDYWVKDSLLLYLHKGQLKLFQHGRSIVVEPYVPERWQVEGGLLAYLDINRELRGIVGGERFRFGSEANIATFDLFGQAVVYRSPLGNTVVATSRRNYVF
jgi:hypothetical protein